MLADPSTTLRMTIRGWRRRQRACIGLLLYGSFDYAQDDETREAEEPAGVHKARAGRSFGYAQDDETGAAETVGGRIGLVLYGSFDYAQDDETGAAAETVGVHRAVAVWRALFLLRFPLARHPERSRRIHSALAEACPLTHLC